MAVECASMSRGRMLRITKLNECGAIVEGAGSSLVAKAFVSATFTPNYAEVQEISVADANGDACVEDRSPVTLRWVDMSVVICTLDPTMINLITGDPLVLNDAASPDTVGFRLDADLTGSANFAIEFWSGIVGQACDPSGFTKYGYWLFPWVKDAQWGEWVIQNDALTITLTARAIYGGDWGVGPYDIRRDAVTPATLKPLLTPIGATQPMHYEVTSAPLPTPACGAVTLTVP
ncbi:hypothetical protein ACFUGD_02615 [Streptomyces sp. NPDC057217]|uniref:hypothetical protein n=1 Tax=Streptomyces sp. NPDC057217 TaxID=3346054 RepID=UPI003626FEDD